MAVSGVDGEAQQEARALLLVVKVQFNELRVIAFFGQTNGVLQTTEQPGANAVLQSGQKCHGARFHPEICAIDGHAREQPEVAHVFGISG